MAEAQSYDASRYPFTSRSYDADITNGVLVQDLIDKSIPFSETSLLDYFEVTDGKGALYRNLNPNDPGFKKSLAASSDEHREARIFFCIQDESRRIPVSLSRCDFVTLLEVNEVPPGYVEIFAINNGVRNAYVTYATESCTPESFQLFIKLPMAPSLNGSIYFRYNIAQKSTTCLIFGTYLSHLEQRLQNLFPSSRPSTHSPSTKDPFLILSAVFAEYSSLLERERRHLDLNVQAREAKTGKGAVIYNNSLRASAIQYASLTEDLHITEALLMFFVRTVEYQTDCTEFLLDQHEVLLKLLSDSEIAATNWKSHKVRDSLNLTTSFSRNRLSQVKTLSRRIQIQLNVVANLIAQNDSRTYISIAEQSTRIASAAKDDNVAVRTIAILTMMFLPGTFIATFFAMPFFHIGSEDEVRLIVDSTLWLYPAVTIPATALVFALWYGWSRLNLAAAMREEKKLAPKELVVFDDAEWNTGVFKTV